MLHLRNPAAALGIASVVLAVLAACSSDDTGDAPAPPSDGGSDMPSPDAADPADAAPPEPSFARDVRPVFASKCNYCHHPGSATHLDLTNPFDPEVGVVNRENSWDPEGDPLVEPGRPQNSFLMVKITREDLDVHESGNPMPWHVPRLTPEEIASLRQWITDGAQDDAFFRDTIALIFGDGLTLGRRAGKCASCHYTGGSLRPDLVDPFDPESGVVDVVGAYGRTLVVPGDPDASLLIQKVEDEDLDPMLGSRMPLWPERVTPAEADAIARWIEAGARDD